MIDNQHIKIMVVDDEIVLEELVRQRFRKQIQEGKYDFVFAHNGLEALSKLIEYPEIGVILCDINMPEMDGLTLLSELKELQNPSLKTVMVSAYGDMENIRTAMNRGAYDFITKPINYEDLGITIDRTLDEIFRIRNAKAEHDKLVSIHQDFEIAKNLQQAILPKCIPQFPDNDCFDIYGCIIAAKEIAGDFFDYFMIDDHRLGFVIGDVSGKGVPASISMAVSRTLIRATGQKGLASSECINYVNALFCHESTSLMFINVFYGVLNISNGELNYTNAGHCNPFILNTNGTIFPLESTNGIKLGFDENFVFEDKNILLQTGDTILLYTDGVTDAANAKKELYGEERLKEMLQESSGIMLNEITSKIISDVSGFTKSQVLSDDIVLLAVRWNGN